MKRITITLFAVVLTVIVMQSTANAEIASADDARTVATNWIALIEHLKGDWGGADAAAVSEVREFTRDDRLLGYFCNIEPRGYIVVSLQKNLAPVKAYSTTDYIDPNLDLGMTDLIKGSMEGILDSIEHVLGPIASVDEKDLAGILEIDYGEKWTYLNRDRDIFKSELESGQKLNYQEGGLLLSTSWNQNRPYNDHCPDMGCNLGPCTPNTRAWAGCLATAAAQIMRHWSWPPYGDGTPYNDPYDWINMPDSFLVTDCPWPTAQIDAVAELLREAGIGLNMDYGCDGSSAYFEDEAPMFDNKFRYDNDCYFLEREDHTADGWWSRMTSDFNQNRPIQYNIDNHSIVADGWREVGGIRQYHMNYGWGGGFGGPWDWTGYTSSNTWFTMGSLPGGGLHRESMTRRIFPERSFGSSVTGTYSLQTFPYRYVDQDAAGDEAIIEAGQHIQFLPNVTLTGTSTTGGEIRIEGSGSENSILFTRGDESIGVRIAGGALTLENGGSIVFR